MTFHNTGGYAPAYRLAPDTPAEIGADLARLVAGSTGNAFAADHFRRTAARPPVPCDRTPAELDRQRDGGAA